MVEKLNDVCVPRDGPIFEWVAEGIGFGEIRFSIEDGTVTCDNEGMSKEFIKRMLCKMVDDAVMDLPSSKDE